MTVPTQISAALAGYAASFSALDTAAICRFWLIPAAISAGAQTTCFGSRAALAQNVEALCSFYRRQGAAGACVSVSSCNLILPSCANVSAACTLLDADGGIVNAWTHHYTLRQAEGVWRIAFAVADEEIAAWARRGTPLG